MARPLNGGSEMTICTGCGHQGATWGGLCWDCQMEWTGGNFAEAMLAAEECGLDWKADGA